MPLKVNIVIISYKFNFFTESLLESLGEVDCNVYLIHNGKTEEQINDFKNSHPIKRTFQCKEQSHDILLDKILIHDSVYEEILDCNWVLFLDHDVVWKPGVFKSELNYILNNIHKEARLAGPGFPKKYNIRENYPPPGCLAVRYFFTYPFFMISPKFSKNFYQNNAFLSKPLIQKIKDYQGSFIKENVTNQKDLEFIKDKVIMFDTCQRIAYKLEHRKIKRMHLFQFQKPNGYMHHLGISWRPAKKPDPIEKFFKNNKDLTHLYKEIYKPRRADLEVMKNYPFFCDVISRFSSYWS